MQSKFTLPLVLSLALAFPAFGQSVNPFKSAKQKPIPTQAATSAAASSTSTPAAVPLVTPPGQTVIQPPSLQLPPALPSATAALPALPPVEKQSESKDEGKSTVDKDAPFLTKEALDAKRAACNLQLEGSSIRTLGAGESDLIIKFNRKAGQGCISAVSFDGTWLDAQIDSTNNEVILFASDNSSSSSRSSTIQVVAGDQTFKLRVKQDGIPFADARAKPEPKQAEATLQQ